MNSSHRFRTVAATAFAFGAGALVLSGCSSDAGGEGSSGGTADDPITLTYMHRLPDGEGMTPVADIVAEWNEAHPEIQVESTKFDGASPEMILKLETDIKANAGPCLAQVGYGEVPELFTKGLVQDVSEFTEQYADNFSAGAYALMGVGEAVVGLPQDTGPLVYFYDESAFEDLGIEVPTDLDELRAAAETAAADGKYVAAFTADEAHNWLAGQAAAAGDTWFAAEDDEWVVNTTGEGTQRVAGLWQDLIDADQVLVEQRWSDNFTAAITSGDLIGHVGAAWEAGFLLDDLDGTDAEGTWRVAQLPDFGAGQITGPDGGSGVAVMEGCEHPEAAVEFTNWFNTQNEALASQGLVIAADGAVETPEKMLRQFGGQDVMSVLAEANATLSPDFTYVPGFSALSSMNESAANAGSGKASVEDIFSEAQTTMVSTLENLGLPVAGE